MQNPLAPASELGEKAQVVFVVEADVVDAVFQHGNALHAHAKGKAGIDIRIITHLGEHRRVDQPGTQDLQPARLFADPAALAAAHDAGDVHLGAGLGEGEKTGPETERQIAVEDAPAEAGEYAFQIGKGHVPIHQKPLHLMKHGRMRDVGIAAVDLARRKRNFSVLNLLRKDKKKKNISAKYQKNLKRPSEEGRDISPIKLIYKT